MGLASSLSTALTGLTAAETTIDVVGNNLANSNTVGFKASQAAFATQFLQTLSLGSSPTDTNGGTNPRQLGLGTMIADVTPNFNQGTIEISTTPTDLAIQGDGFFMVQSSSGERLYTRNGMFKLNSNNELVSLTGNRVLGFGVDAQYKISTTQLEPLTIPLGSAAVAQATQNAYLQGTLTPSGDLSTQGTALQSGILTDGSIVYANTTNSAAAAIGTMTAPGVAANGVGGLTNGTYYYRYALVDSNGQEGPLSSASVAVNVAGGGGTGSVDLSGLPSTSPTLPTGCALRLYRSTDNVTYNATHTFAVGAVPATYNDAGDAAGAAPPTLTALDGEYKYFVTYANATYAGGGIETRPSQVGGDVQVNGQSVLSNLPRPTSDAGIYNYMRVYRSAPTLGDPNAFYYVGEINLSTAPAGSVSYIDQTPDSSIDTAKTLNFDKATITNSTLAVNVLRRDGTAFVPVFQEGEFQFTGRKGDRTLTTKSMQITNTTTLQQVINFMSDAMGIQSGMPDANYNYSGVSITNGKIQFVGNYGADNAIAIDLSGMQMKPTGQSGTSTINLPFSKVQDAVGTSAMTDFIAYDSLGIPVNVHITAVLESRDSTATTYRWFADSPQNTLSDGSSNKISVGTGLISFDGLGNFLSATNSTVEINRADVAARSPLAFDLNFDEISGLAANKSSLAVSRQDGSAPGVLSSFIVGEDGLIRGVFSNGVTRDLGQIRLARFANPAGLEQRGENMYAPGVNSGLPVEGNPGEQGIGGIVAGAVELSNTDIGGNLIDLILASTMYRGNSRVITTVQQMFDELMNLRR